MMALTCPWFQPLTTLSVLSEETITLDEASLIWPTVKLVLSLPSDWMVLAESWGRLATSAAEI